MQYINTCNGSRGSYYNLILEVIQNSQSIENNTSNVTMSAYIQSNHSSYYFYGYSATTNLTFNGSTKATNTVTVDTRNGNKVLLATWTGNVEHNSDGTLKVNVGATFTCNYSYVTGGSVSGQFEFNTIPRASKFGNIPDFTLDGNEGVGAPFSVPVTKKSSVLTDTLQIYMPTSSGYTLVATRNNYTSGTVTFSSSELNTIYPLFTTTQVNFRFNLTTKNGSNTIGTDEAYALGKLSTTGLNPTFSNINLTYKDVNSVTTAITGNNQIIIKDFSEMQIILNSKATAHKGATMKNYILGSTGDLQTFSASASLPFNVTEYNPKSSYYVKAIDSRGNQTQVTKNVQTFINYELPNSIKINLKRSNNGAGESVSVSISGKYYNWTGLTVNNEITNIAVDYREKGTSDWSYGLNLTVTNLNGNFSVSETTLGNYDVSKEYEFRFGITDKLSSVTENATLNSGEPYIWHMKNAKIMGIGGKPSIDLSEGSLHLYGDLQIDGKIRELYPVGSIYISVINTNPSIYFGGTWQGFGAGRVLVGVDTTQTDFNSAMKTGGEKKHTLSVNEIPSHRHPLIYNGNNKPVNLNASGSANAYGLTNWNGTALDSNAELYGNYVGGGQSHNNLQPYITVYMWRRTD